MMRWIEQFAGDALQPPDGPQVDFTQPADEPALVNPDSISWIICKNPVTMFIGGVAAVILELAEPRVRAGIWDHTSFRDAPLRRLQRTALAAMLTVYGAESQARAMIEAVSRRHAGITGTTDGGQPYRADDPELLDWVQTTASFGFLQAYTAYVRPLTADQRGRYWREATTAAHLYGATGAPISETQAMALFGRTQNRLEASPIVFEFLRILGDAPLLPWIARPLQRLMVRAAIELVPPDFRALLQLDAVWSLTPRQRWLVSMMARAADRIVLRGSPWVQSCQRLGLPDDWLYRRN